MAFEIDLDAIQRSAKDAIKAQQTELNVALGAAGKPLIAVDGIVGPQTLQAIDDVAELGKDVVVDKSCPVGQHWDEGLQRCVDDEPADDRPPMPSSEGLTGTQHWVWLEVAKRWDIAGEEEDDGDSESVNAFKQWTLSQQQATQAAAEAGLESAQQILAGLVADFGLPATLAAKLNAELVRGESPTALAMRIRQTEEYAGRFPAMGQRRELGLPAISETDYLNIERQYRSVMQAAKLPSTFHDEPADFTEWIAGDVSPQEFQERVVLAETARDSADAETRRLLSDFYDISDGDLTAYYLDPTRAETIFEDRRRLESAGLAAASRQTVGQALEMETAEALQAESVQRREIQQRLGQRAGLTGELLGSEAMTASEIAEGEFGLDVEAIATLRRRREGRVAGFRGTAGALTTGAGITGFGAAE